MRSVFFAAIAGVLSCSFASAAQTIFLGGASAAPNPGNQPLYTVDPATGALTTFLPAVTRFEGMAYDTTRNRIVATQRGSNQIRTIDPITSVVGTLTASTPATMEGLAYDSNRDLFWATDQQTGNLYKINPVTGMTTLALGPPLGGGTVFPGGLGFDPVADILYAIDDNRLYRINPNTFATVPIGAAGLGVGFTDVDAMDFDQQTGLLYIVNDFGTGGTPAVLQQFASLDPATGIASVIGSTGLAEQAGQGMAIIAPEPTTLAALSIGAMFTRRRRA